MEPTTLEYRGHRIEVRVEDTERSAEPALLIDDEVISYGRLPDGSYFLDAYAYDWSDNLTSLATRFIDYRDLSDAIRRETEPK